MNGLSQRMVGLGTARSEIRELFEYGKGRIAAVGADRVFDFSIGNPSVPPPASVERAIERLLREESSVALHGYTSAVGDPWARAKLAENLNARMGTDYGADDLYLTAGAAGALCSCLGAVTCPGDHVIVLAPYFPEYKVFVESAGAELRVVPTLPETFQLDLDALARAIDGHTKAVIINSPNNPSGAVYPAADLKRLGALLRERSREYGRPVWLFSDEPYREVYYGAEPLPWLPDFYEHTLVCYSFSKSLSLPGERVGYVLVPPALEGAAEVRAAVIGAGRSLGYVCAPSLFQRVCAACAGETADLGVYRKNRDLLLAGLCEMGFSCAPPQGTFYLFLRAAEPDARAFSLRARELDLLLVPGDSFGAPGYVRISYCVPTERIERALPVFAQLAAAYAL